MKKMYKNIARLFIASLLVFTSCETDLDINTDPDLLNPGQVPMASELPAAITGIGAASGSYYAILGGFWSQFWTQSAAANQYKAIDDYSLNSSASLTENSWSAMYDALTDVRNVKANALAEENWNYYLIATSLEVHASQILVDLYGAIPYSQANDPAILKPEFDSAATVYDAMVVDLKEALSKDLSLSPIENTPGTSDFIFAGDMDQWTAFANTLLLKIYLRQTEVRSSVAESSIKTLINSGATFLNADAAITQFSDEDSRSNPLYESDRRQLNVATNLRASTTMGGYLEANADPRLAEFYDGTTFQNQGDYNDGSSSSSVVLLSPTTAVYFISLAESKFMQAEADVRYMGGAKAKTLYEEGVSAAFAQWGVDGSALITGAYAYPNGSTAKNIEAIITQKWIASFPGNGFESFIEQNRTGYPMISTVGQTSATYVPGQLVYSIEGKTSGKFPKRLEFPQTEKQRNSNTPDIIKATEPVWYDAN